MSDENDLKFEQWLMRKSTVANFVALIVCIGGFVYCALTRNTDGVIFITGTALGYLYKTLTPTPKK